MTLSEITGDQIGLALVGLVSLLGGVGHYINKYREKPGTAPIGVLPGHVEITVQLRRIADGVEGYGAAMKALGPMAESFTEAVDQIHKVLGPLLADSAKAQMQIASKREAQLRDMMEEMSERLERMEEKPARPAPRRKS